MFCSLKTGLRDRAVPLVCTHVRVSVVEFRSQRRGPALRDEPRDYGSGDKGNEGGSEKHEQGPKGENQAKTSVRLSGKRGKYFVSYRMICEEDPEWRKRNSTIRSPARPGSNVQVRSVLSASRRK